MHIKHLKKHYAAFNSPLNYATTGITHQIKTAVAGLKRSQFPRLFISKTTTSRLTLTLIADFVAVHYSD